MTHDLIDPKAHKQLFIDDHAVERLYAIERTLHQPDRKGAVLQRDRDMGQVRVAAWSVPIWNPEKDLWEWWYNGHYGETDAYFNHYATSTDGVHWDKPDLGLHEWQGSKNNNIALDPSDKSGKLDSQAGLGLYHILRDDRDPDPGRRYKGLFGANNRYLGVSPDGFDWTMLDTPPIPSKDTSKFFYDPYTEQFVATIKLPTQWGRSVWVTTSSDFDHFSEPRLVLHSDEIDRENRRRRVRKIVEDPSYFTPPIVDDEDYIAEVYLMPVMPYEGMYVGFPNLFNPFGAIPAPHGNFTRINQPELALSRDLYSWDRVADRELFLPVHPWDGTAYDTSQISICGAPIVRGDEIWIYYNGYRIPGYKYLHEVYDRNRELFRLKVDPAVFEDIGAMNLATLRLDGFVSLDAPEVGKVVTKPFTWRGERLFVNVDATWGELRAEVLEGDSAAPPEPAGPPIGPDNFPTVAGFDRVTGIPVTGDHVRAEIRWDNDTPPNFERPVRLRFTMRQARLYSFWLE